MSALLALCRLTFRDAQRHPLRFALLVALIAIPTAGAVVTSILVRTTVDRPEERTARTLGQADALVTAQGNGVSVFPGAARAVARLPLGTRALAVHETVGRLVVDEGGRRRRRIVTLLNVPLGDPLLTGHVALTSGRAPSGADEAAVSPGLLHAVGISVGDRLRLTAPAVSLTVTGIATFTGSTDQDPLVVSPVVTTPTTRWLVDRGPLSEANLLARLPGPGYDVQSRTSALDGTDDQTVSLALYLMSGLMLMAVALIAAAAFSVSARRQLATIGVLSANGTTPRQARVAMTVRGLVVGLVGATSGCLLGLAIGSALATQLDGFTHKLNGTTERWAGDFVLIAILAVVAATLAAGIPTWSLARIPVRTALAGRRPLTPARFRLPIAGVAAAALGCLLLMLSVRDLIAGDAALVAVALGAALAVGGFAAWAPFVVQFAGRNAHRLAGTGRLAVRSAARNRTRTSATVAAIVAIFAVSFGAVTLMRSVDAEVANGAFKYPGPDRVEIVAQRLDARKFGAGNVPLPPELLRAVTNILPGAVVGVAETPDRFPAIFGNRPFLTGAWSGYVTDERGLDALGVSNVREALRAGAFVAVLSNDAPVPQRTVTVPARDGNGRLRTAPVVVRRGHSTGLSIVVVSPRAARDYGLSVGSANRFTLVRSPRPLTLRQTQALADLNTDWQFDGSSKAGDIVANVASPFVDAPRWRGWEWGIALAAGVLTLIVVAVSLALAAVDGRDERATLDALGATPAVQRTLRAWNAGLVTLTGIALALPAGILPAWAVFAARRTNSSTVDVPWLVVAALAAGVFLLATLGAAFVARSRPLGVERRLG